MSQRKKWLQLMLILSISIGGTGLVTQRVNAEDLGNGASVETGTIDQADTTTITDENSDGTLGGSIAQQFGMGELYQNLSQQYKSISEIYTTASGIYDSVKELTSGLDGGGSGSRGIMGIQDPGKLYEAAVKMFAANPEDPNAPVSIDMLASRLRAVVAAKTGSAPVTKEGQAKAAQAAQQQSNLAAAANTAATAVNSADNSLDAIKNSAKITNNLSKEIVGVHAVLTQSNQINAAGVQVQDQARQELTRLNTKMEQEKAQERATANQASKIGLPLFAR
jgi:hypothetical protein